MHRVQTAVNMQLLQYKAEPTAFKRHAPVVASRRYLKSALDQGQDGVRGNVGHLGEG